MLSSRQTHFKSAVALAAVHDGQFIATGQAEGSNSAFAVIGVDCTIPRTPLNLAPLAPGWEMVTALSWKATITYSSNGRNDSVSFNGMSDVWSPIQIDFQGNVQGGSISLSISAPARDAITGQQDTITWSGVSSVIGLNPIPHDTVRSQLGSTLLQVIAYKETAPGQRFQQFKPDGSPSFGAPNGFGIMQLDPPSTARQIWDWQQNVNEGKARFQSAQSVVTSYISRMMAANPELPDLTDEQVACSAATYYNGGGSNGFHYIPNATGDDWIRNPNSSGNIKFANALDYGDAIIDLLNAVQSGSPPADW